MKELMDLAVWREILVGAFVELGGNIARFLPSLVGALLILLLGWIISRSLEIVAARTLRAVGLDSVLTRLRIAELIERAGIGLTFSQIVAKLIFWLVMLTFLLSGVETLGLSAVTDTIDRLISFIPSLIGAALIAIGGLLLGRFLGTFVSSAAAAAGFASAPRLGFLTQIIAVGLVFIVAVEQIGIATNVLVVPFTVALAAAGASIGFAFALGARQVITHIMAGHFLKQSLPRHVPIEFNGNRGVVDRVGAVDTLHYGQRLLLVRTKRPAPGTNGDPSGFVAAARRCRGEASVTMIDRLAEHALENHPHSSATVLERLDEQDTIRLLNHGTISSAIAIIQRLSPQFATNVIVGLKPDRVTKILNAIPLDFAVRLIRRIPEANQSAILDDLEPKRARGIRSVLQFAPGSAGALMDPDVLALPQELTVREALQRLRKNAELARYHLYVVNQEHTLVGVISLRELLLARGRQVLADVMVRDPYRVRADIDRASLLAHRGWKEVHTLPVVDENSAFVGVIRYRTLRQIEEELLAPRLNDVDTGAAFGQVIAAAAGGVLDALGGSANTSARKP